METIIAKCIDSYTAKRAAGEENIDKRLETIVDRMFDRCFQHGQYRQALGIAIETRRLDVFEKAVSAGDQSDREVWSLTFSYSITFQLIGDKVCDMLSYAFRVVMSLIQKRDYRYS